MLAQPMWLLLAAPVLALGWWATRTSGGRPLRLAILALAILALADPRLPGATARAPVTLLVDVSRSVGVDGAREARTIAESVTSRGRELRIVAFGERARQVPDLAALAGIEAQEASDLAAGLDLAVAGAADRGGDVVVISDGAWTGRDPLLAAAALDTARVRVHAALVGEDRGGDTAVTQVVGPARVAAGQAAALGVEVWSPRAATGRLQVRSADGTPLLATPQAVALVAGRNTLSVAVAAAPTASLLDVTIEVAVDGDPEPGNDAARFVSEVVGGPRVVLVNRGGAPTELAAALRSALAGSGTPVDVVDAKGFGASVAALGRAAAVVLEDVPLSALADGGDRAIAAYVDEIGGGLVVTGGPSSYANGGYFHSALEPLLPVSLDRREQVRRPAVAVGIVLDRSGSMAAPTGFGPTKMDLADQSAVAAIQLLEEGDAVTVLAVDTEAHVVIPLQRLGPLEERRAIHDDVLAIESMGGGIYLEVALRAVMHVLDGADTVNRHVVLFSDAADTEEPGKYKELVQAWARAGFTLSVIGLGDERDPDAGLLREVGRLAGGRVYFTRDARRLPSIFAEDVMQVAASAWVPDPVAVARGTGRFAAPTAVGGHHVTVARGKAEAWWRTADEDTAPLLAGWPHGAGRVVAAPFAWSGADAGPFPAWSGYRDLARELIEWVRRPAGTEDVVADVVVRHGQAEVTLEVDPHATWTRAPELVVVGPDQEVLPPVALAWDGPGRLRGAFPLRGPGVHLGLARIGGEVVPLPPVVLPQPPELAFDPDAAQRRSTLAALAAATGGTAVFAPSALDDPPAVSGGRRLQGWLAALVVALVLADIAHRRGLLAPAAAWAEARAPRVRLPSPRRTASAPPAEAPAPPAPAEVPVDPLAEARRRARGRGPRT